MSVRRTLSTLILVVFLIGSFVGILVAARGSLLLYKDNSEKILLMNIEAASQRYNEIAALMPEVRKQCNLSLELEQELANLAQANASRRRQIEIMKSDTQEPFLVTEVL